MADLKKSGRILGIEEFPEIRGIRGMLLELAEPDYARFASGLLRKPGDEQLSGSAAHVLGVRLPALRKLAKKLTKEDWRGSLEQLAGRWQSQAEPVLPCSEESVPIVSFEEIMLWGFLIGSAKVMPESPAIQNAVSVRSVSKRAVAGAITLQEQFALIRSFVSAIDNWSLCDSFCAGLKFAREYPAQTWDFLQEFFRSEEEYAIRFGVVMLLNYFITGEYIDRLFPVFDAIEHEGYYVKMAVAWAISICYVKFPQETETYLADNQLDDFTYNKALQKIIESRCISEEVRVQMRERKRK